MDRYNRDVRALPRSFYVRDSITVARELIGKLIVRFIDGDRIVVRIVETEAYNQEDPASHSFRGRTPRTEPMFAEGGCAYVYFIYGMYDCFNVVTDRMGYGSAVLIRAGEPLAGIRRMWTNRFPGRRVPDGISDGDHRSDILSFPRAVAQLSNGPGKLARSLDLRTSRDSGHTLLRPESSDLWIADDGKPVADIGVATRIGISVATSLPWRFFMIGSSFVSDYRPRISRIRSRSAREK